MKKIPIGIQAFSSLIEGGFVYLDKTDMIYNIANTKACYFLSRPRRFGKSLTLSTLHEYFDGQKDLFVGTKMEKLETKWEKYPVVHFDFNASTYKSVEDVISRINFMLSNYEDIFGRNPHAASNSERFESLINAIAAQTGKHVVILVDEYDKPLLTNMSDTDLQDKIRAELKAFYGVLKTCDKQIKIAFITGVTKFSKVSLFSDVNNLTDISQEREFSTLCGITEQEIHEQLDEYVQQMADLNEISKEECYKELKKWYEGYHFSKDSEKVFNPCSLLRSLERKETDNFWIETGTPSFLVKQIRKYGTIINEFDHKKCKANLLSKYVDFEISPIPTLFQCGFLTIIDYDKELETYTLGIPNTEVHETIDYFSSETRKVKEWVKE